MVLKFESTVKIDQNDDVVKFEDNENMTCQYFGSEIKYEAEIWSLKLILDADFYYCVDSLLVSTDKIG